MYDLRVAKDQVNDVRDTLYVPRLGRCTESLNNSSKPENNFTLRQ
jgi:hypothetical protein